MDTDSVAVYSAFCGSFGATMAMAFTALGAAYGTAKSGTGIAGMAVARPDLIMKSILPVVMSSVIAIYGLVVSVLIVDDIREPKEYGLFKGFNGMFAGVSCGVAGLAAGYAIGIVGDTGVRGVAQEPKMFVGMILVLIFAEVLGLYGLIIAIIMLSKS